MSSIMSFGGGFNVNLAASFGMNPMSLANTLMGGLAKSGGMGGMQIMNFASSFQMGGMGVNMSMSANFSMAWSSGSAYQPAVLPPPRPEFAAAPAGKGLQKDPAGWPKGSVRTAGGYTVVPDGGTRWRIFNPGQKASDKAGTTVSGDPHVTEKDGGRWDFSKTSNFTLPDGTKIKAQTSAETGHSVTTGLDITNGADHVGITGVNGRPTTGAVKHDGYEFRAKENAAHPNRPNFKLGGDGDDWFMAKNGKMGEITGAKYTGGSYHQVVNNKGYRCDANLRPPIGSDSWGNMLRDTALDFITGMPGISQFGANLIGQGFHLDHAMDQLANNMMKMAPYSSPFGGLYGMASGFGGAFDAMAGMSDAMNSLNSLAASQMGFRSALMFG